MLAHMVEEVVDNPTLEVVGIRHVAIVGEISRRMGRLGGVYDMRVCEEEEEKMLLEADPIAGVGQGWAARGWGVTG